MMKLYFSPGACSMASHITALELGVAIELVRVDLVAKTTADGANYLDINPKGSVPTLATKHGFLTENVAIQQYLADHAVDTQLLPSKDSFDHYRVLEWLNFVATELHKNIGGFFDRTLTDVEKQRLRTRAESRLNVVEKSLVNSTYLLGEHFTLADIYLFVVLRWTHYHGFDLPTQWPSLARFVAHMRTRESVQKALAAEGLKK